MGISARTVDQLRAELGLIAGVGEDAQAGGVRDCLVILVEAVIARLPVVGRHNEEAVHAGALGELRHLRAHRRIDPHTRQHETAAVCGFDGRGDHVLPLGERQRKELAGAARRQHCRRAFTRQEIYVAAQAVEIEGIIIIKRGNGKRDHGAQSFAQFRWGHHW